VGTDENIADELTRPLGKVIKLIAKEILTDHCFLVTEEESNSD
jgi:hypothetical protein